MIDFFTEESYHYQTMNRGKFLKILGFSSLEATFLSFFNFKNSNLKESNYKSYIFENKILDNTFYPKYLFIKYFNSNDVFLMFVSEVKDGHYSEPEIFLDGKFRKIKNFKETQLPITSETFSYLYPPFKIEFKIV